MQNVARLIEKFTPEHYQLHIDIQREKKTFTGLVTINGTAKLNGELSVHAKDLTISSVLVDGKAATYKPGKDDELIIRSESITPGRHIVVIGFNGVINETLHGMYPCHYQHDGKEKELIMTQFESHHARETFPCIDEPEAKATFDISLTTETGVTVLGNMPVTRQAEEDGRLVTTFDTTPRMSTYLVAWMVGELHKKTAVTKRGIEVNVWATPAQPAASLDFALDIAVRSIDFYEEYFATPYPLPKSDHIAVPDFSSGAMENWGLITYREVALLADPATTSISSKHYIATVIAHELSHQWFGNLVTMKWWNNLWLNESFATLMEFIAIDALEPDWNVWLDFATLESIHALRRDSLDGVQSVQVDVHHPDEISTLFDSAIVYAKGARLLRMCQNYIGHSAFQAGLKDYFSIHAYGNTEGDDLWGALSKASGKDITRLMNTWISQPGYPVVTITEQNDTLTLSQQRFFVGPHEQSANLWPIPLNASLPEVPALLEDASTTIPRPSETIRLNVGDTAHFITRYDSDILARLVDMVKSDSLAPLDRVQLLDEQTLLARGGVMSSAELIPLLDAYKNETTEPVWDIIAMAIGELKKFVNDDKASEDQLRAFAGRLAAKQFSRLGWDALPQEAETDTKLRITILGLLLYSYNQEAIAEAIRRFDTTNLESLNPEQRSLIIGTKVRHDSSNTLIESLIKAYTTSASADLRADIAAGLTSTRDEAVIRRLLSLLTDTSVVRPQDTAYWFVWLLRNRDGRVLTWQWLRDNWSWIEKTFGGDKSYDDYPRYAASGLVTREQLEEYKAFFTPLKSVPALTRVISIGIGEISGRVELLERDTQAVRQALAKQSA